MARILRDRQRGRKVSGPVTLEIMRHNLRAAQRAWRDRCVACGSRNGRSLALKFEVSKEGQIEGSFPCEVVFEGFPDHRHGGSVATVLDAAMTNRLFAHGLVGLTAELKVRYHQAVSVGSMARLLAWLERSSHRLHFLRASLEQKGTIKATACAKFLETAPGAAAGLLRGVHA